MHPRPACPARLQLLKVGTLDQAFGCAQVAGQGAHLLLDQAGEKGARSLAPSQKLITASCDRYRSPARHRHWQSRIGRRAPVAMKASASWESRSSCSINQGPAAGHAAGEVALEERPTSSS